MMIQISDPRRGDARRREPSPAGRDTSSDGTTLQLTRTGGRWLVSAVLLW